MSVPDVIHAALDAGAVISISVSGGKDSQAMLNLMNGFDAPEKRIIHADLGRAEWPQTPMFIGHLSRLSGLPVDIVRRVKGDLVQRIEERLKSVSTLDPTRVAKPFWPSAQQRYCTSDLKRDPIHKQQRKIGKDAIIISCIGFRADESPARRKRKVVSIDKRITSKKYKDLEPGIAIKQYDGGRLVLTWLPIHEWKVGRVWEEIGTTETCLIRRQKLYNSGNEEKAVDGWPAHVAYVYGNERLSCALCILASKGDLCNGKKHHPELYEKYIQLEDQAGYSFRDGFSLRELN